VTSVSKKKSDHLFTALQAQREALCSTIPAKIPGSQLKQRPGTLQMWQPIVVASFVANWRLATAPLAA